MKNLIVILFSIFSSFFAFSEEMHVVFLNPGGDNRDIFWQMATDFIEPAARDMGIKLEILYSNRDHLRTVSQVEEVLSREDLPDYILTGNDKSNAGEIIEQASRAGVKVFLINNGFILPRDIEEYGQPREKYPLWIGQFIPDNQSAGYQMAKHLIDTALEKGMVDSKGQVQLLAMAGAYQTHASDMRIRGLKAAVAEYPEKVILLQIIPGDWSAETAKEKMHFAYQRYPRLNAFWGVNDATALGAMKALKEFGIQPGKDVLFAGCNWGEEAVNHVQRGTMVTSVGGHFMDGAWALVMLFDYHHGIDFISDQPEPMMYAIEEGNVSSYLQLTSNNDWDRIDFKQFSKVHTQSISHYDFSISAVLDQIK